MEKRSEIRIKIGMIGNEIISIKPEYEDVRKVSEETGIPLKDVTEYGHSVFMNKYPKLLKYHNLIIFFRC